MDLWNEYFPDLNGPSYVQKNAKITEAGLYFVNFAQFQGLGDQGVIILIGNNSTALLVFASSFKDSFYSSYHGGSIYLEKGSIVQYRVCSTGSHDNPNFGGGGHCYTQVNEEAPNLLIESTISSCDTSRRAFELDFGPILVQSTNTSHYQGKNLGAFCISKANPFCEIKYSLTANNSCPGACVGLFRKNHIVSHSLFIYNSYTDGSSTGLIKTVYGGSASFSNCSFVKNTGSNLFYGGSITVTNCFINNPGCEIGQAEVASTYTDQFELVLFFLSTYQCDADNKLMNPVVILKPLYITRYILCPRLDPHILSILCID